MSDFFNAHIVGRHRHGDREEVRMKLFNADGSPFSGRGATILIGEGNPNSLGFSGITVVHDDFSEFHLSDPTWWERSVPDPDVVWREEQGVLEGPAWGGVLLPGGPQTKMRTTVEFASVDGLSDQIGALVRAEWIGPTDDVNNFSYVGAWIMSESVNTPKLAISGHGPLGYHTDFGSEVNLIANSSYWIRCTIDEQSLVTAELFIDPPENHSPIANLSSVWDSPNSSGYGGVNLWVDNITFVRDILVESLEPLPVPGVSGDYWLDSESKKLYGPRGENDYPIMPIGLGVPQIYDQYFTGSHTTDRNLDPETATLEETVNVLVTLLEDLKSIGIIKP